MSKGIIVILLCCMAVSVRATESPAPHTILVIHSYHPDMQWVKEVHQGIEDRLRGALTDLVDIKVEYMDSKRYFSPVYNLLLAALWRYKYTSRPPEVVIACDDNALNLILDLRQEIFAGVPVVFCGVNAYDRARFAGIHNITGVIEAFDLRGTLDIIKSLMPERRRLFIINDNTTTGRANKRRLEEIAYDYAGHFNFMYSGNLSAEALAETVRTLQGDTAVLLMSFNRDANDRMLRYRDAVRIVRDHCRQPIFGVWSFYLNRGIVGGSLVNGRSQGEEAADMAIRIIRGTPASSLPILRDSPNLPMFDYNELKRFDLDFSLLPPGSIVVNAPDTFWHRYWKPIIFGLSVFLIQLFVILLLFHNIRRRRKSEEMLLKNQQNLTITLEAIGEAVISVDAQQRVMRANPAAAELLETPFAELPGKALAELLVHLDADTGPMLADLVKECCLSGKQLEIPPKTILRPNGKPAKHLIGSCSPIEDQDLGLIGAVLICRDVSEREAMQAMLVHSQKMEAIGQLAGGVAHDFNNLLTGISGFAELLSIQLREDEEKMAYAMKILGASGRARDLTRQLLSFARKGKVSSSPIDCHQALRSTIALLERSIDKRIALESRLEAKKHIIIGDPVQLENSFLNLGINGADAMADGGTLTFSTANRRLEGELSCEFGEVLGPGEYLVVSISDTGSGIDENLRQQIFEPFFTTKEHGKGTGLGLAAVFGTVKEHGGRIRLHSEVGRGTTFEIFFQLGDRGAAPEPEEAFELQQGSGTILVIDDEQLVLFSVAGLLTELGYTVITADGCRQGLARYSRQKREIDVVILDMIMPEMNGIGCFAELKKIDPGVRVIISSGYAKSERIQETENLGSHGFLQKPYSAASLSKAIRKAMQAD